MSENRNAHQIQRLMVAEIQFRLASAVRLATIFEEQPLDLPAKWHEGEHVVRYEEVALRADQAEVAAQYLQMSATFLMATAMRDAIVAAVGDPRNSSDPSVRAAYQITRMIRNAFTHDPVRPVWSIDKDCRDVEFEVPNVIRLNTHNLNGRRLEWTPIGGPLAVLRLNQFVRFTILGEERRERQLYPPPKSVFFQQGKLIFRKVDNLPEGLEPVEFG